jgi:hypothetical protein
MKERLSFILVLITIVISCEQEKEITKTYKISGTAQKGPYIVGTYITISELEADLTPTGKNYYTTITDYIGSFEMPDVELNSNYVKLIADGSYFNEINDINGQDRLILSSLADLNDSSSVNINVLTHLETDRLEYLIQKSGLSFSEAKKKAQNEILAIFNLDSENSTNFEFMDITKSGDDNARLLAISSIIQGNWSRSINALTELFANIKTDIKADGTLDNADIKYDLKLHAELLRFNNIEKNLKNKYNLDIVPNFQKMINYYLDNNEVETNLRLGIPTNTESGANLLSISDGATLNKDTSYCIAANVHYVHPQDSIVFNVAVEKENAITWNFTEGHNETIDGWNYRVFNNSIICELKEQDRLCILPIGFSGQGKITIRISINPLKIGSTYVSRELNLH